ncbi:MAG: hypothetical protein LJF15_11080 [Acidobacteria bacterium]|jgi:hypothetical protein|nr:hypothetical protein [Acidobacteriota bacterium]
MRGSPLRTVCAWCQKVRDPSGEWCETELPEPAGRIATHGICPDCLERATSRATIAVVSQ